MDPLARRRLGLTEVEVTQLGFGGAGLGDLFEVIPDAHPGSRQYSSLDAQWTPATWIGLSQSALFGSRRPSFASKENYGTTLDMLFVGSRVCVCGRPQICGEVARPAASTLETRVGNPNRRHYRVSRSGRRVGRKLTGRVIVRLDPPHPAWRGTLRSFRPERLVICS
jgi:hypothetical protein